MKRKPKKAVFRQDAGKEDITLGKLITYNILFFFPILLAVFVARIVSRHISFYFQANNYVITQILMVITTLILFFFLVPFIRKRENIQGVRYALLGFIIVGFSITLPALIKGNYGILLSALIPIANYILLTFIYCPEVLGMDVDIGTWFEHYKQLSILLVYGGMIMMYVCGFGWIYYQMAIDTNYGNAFDMPDTQPSYATFVYYSVIIFGTIGFGDITPLSKAARFVSAFEAILALIINVIFIAILFVYVSNFRDFLNKETKELEKAERTIKKFEKGMKKNRKKSRAKRKK